MSFRVSSETLAPASSPQASSPLLSPRFLFRLLAVLAVLLLGSLLLAVAASGEISAVERVRADFNRRASICTAAQLTFSGTQTRTAQHSGCLARAEGRESAMRVGSRERTAAQVASGVADGRSSFGYDSASVRTPSLHFVATETGSEGVDLTKGGRDKIGTLEGDKDKTVADVIRERGGGGAQVRDVGHWGERTLGEAANAAAAGDKAAEKAVKGAKQAGTKGQRKYGK